MERKSTRTYCSNNLGRRAGSTLQRRSERGNAVIEFALGFSLLWIIFSGLYQFGYSFYVYNKLHTAVANAAELGAKMTYDTANATAFTQKLQNMVVYGDETAGTISVAPGLSTSNVNVSMNLDAASMPHDVTISISNYTVSAIFGSFTPNNKPRVTTKYYGTITCSTC
jgi:Flp pilus assembly protein TadG